MSKNKLPVVEKQFEYKGRDCICVFNRLGFRCGYVSVSEKDKGFKVVEKQFFDRKHIELEYDDFDIDCHGGLTYGNKIPKELNPKGNYYIGFDCGHWGDGQDLMQAYDYGLIDKEDYQLLKDSCLSNSGDYVIQLADVIQECKKVVGQLEGKC